MPIVLQQAKDILRNDDSNIPYSWTAGKDIAKFQTFDEFRKYVDDNFANLTSAVAFTGSASMLNATNSYLALKLKKAKLL